MYKFLFNLQTGTLKLVKEDHSLALSEERQFQTLGGIGFTLDYDEPSNHWILFKISGEKVRVVYKSPQKDGSPVYYKREINHSATEIIEVEFTEWDRIKKLRQKNHV